MGFIKKYKTILIIIIIVIVGGIGYNALFKGDGGNLLTSDVDLSASDSAVLIADNDLLKLLLDIRSVKLDDSIFSRDSFKSLEDFGQEIVPEPVGRENPFASVGFIPKTSNKTDIVDEKIESR